MGNASRCNIKRAPHKCLPSGRASIEGGAEGRPPPRTPLISIKPLLQLFVLKFKIIKLNDIIPCLTCWCLMVLVCSLVGSGSTLNKRKKEKKILPRHARDMDNPLIQDDTNINCFSHNETNYNSHIQWGAKNGLAS